MRLIPATYFIAGSLLGLTIGLVSTPERMVVVDRVAEDPAIKQRLEDLATRAEEWELRASELTDELAKSRELNGRMLRHWKNAEALAAPLRANAR